MKISPYQVFSRATMVEATNLKDQTKDIIKLFKDNLDKEDFNDWKGEICTTNDGKIIYRFTKEEYENF